MDSRYPPTGTWRRIMPENDFRESTRVPLTPRAKPSMETLGFGGFCMLVGAICGAVVGVLMMGMIFFAILTLH